MVWLLLRQAWTICVRLRTKACARSLRNRSSDPAELGRHLPVPASTGKVFAKKDKPIVSFCHCGTPNLWARQVGVSFLPDFDPHSDKDTGPRQDEICCSINVKWSPYIRLHFDISQAPRWMNSSVYTVSTLTYQKVQCTNFWSGTYSGGWVKHCPDIISTNSEPWPAPQKLIQVLS